MNNTLKTCAKCKQIKLVTDFGTDKTHKNGLQSWCRACKAAWARRYYATTKGKLAHNRSRQQHTEQRQADLLDCENHCPKCDGEDIEWSLKDIQDNIIYQNAECRSCGCLFTEIWQYHHTEIDEKQVV